MVCPKIGGEWWRTWEARNVWPFKRENDDQPSNLGVFPKFFKENHIYQHSQHSWSCSLFAVDIP